MIGALGPEALHLPSLDPVVPPLRPHGEGTYVIGSPTSRRVASVEDLLDHRFMRGRSTVVLDRDVPQDYPFATPVSLGGTGADSARP